MEKNNWHLPPTAQRILKWIHILFAALFLGGISSLLLIQILRNGILTDQPPFPIDFISYQLFDYTITYSSYGILFTAILYGLFTGWGFFKQYWIIAKWIGFILLFLLVWFRMGPSINGMVALSDGEFQLPGAHLKYTNFSNQGIRFLSLSVFLLSIIFLISVFKPWGKRKLRFTLKQKSKILIIGSLIILTGGIGVLSSLSLERYRNMPIGNTDIALLPNGIYQGEARVGGFTYRVEARVIDHRLTGVKILKNRTSNYARFAEGIIPRIIKHQNANVRAITGATTTSKALMKAVENALASTKHLSKEK